jgi:hypothetical protein
MCQLEAMVDCGGKFPGSIARAHCRLAMHSQRVRGDGYQGCGLAMKRRRRGSPEQEKRPDPGKKIGPFAG